MVDDSKHARCPAVYKYRLVRTPNYPDDSAAPICLWRRPHPVIDHFRLFSYLYAAPLGSHVKFTCRVSRRWRTASEDQSLDSERVCFSSIASQSTKSSPLSRSQLAIGIVAAWWLVPVTNLFFWLRYVHRQRLALSISHLIVLAASVFAALYFQELAAKTLRHRRTSTAVNAVQIGTRPLTISGIVLSLVVTMSVAVRFSSPRFRRFAINFEGAEVSSRPSGWHDPADYVTTAPSDGEGPPIADTGTIKSADTDNPRLKRALDERCGAALGYTRFNVNLAQIKGINLAGLNLQRLQGGGAFLVNADLAGTDLRRADLSQADLRGVILSGADFVEGNLTKARLNFAVFERTDLRKANLQGADLRKVSISQSDVSNASLADANLAEAVMVGNLDGVDLSHSILCDSKLMYSYLNGANLNNVTAIRADFSHVIARKARFRDANLEDADFTEADLSCADLRWSDVKGARFDRAILPASLRDPKKSLVQHPEKVNWKNVFFSDNDCEDLTTSSTAK